MLQTLRPISTRKLEFANCVLDPAFQTLSTKDKITRLRGKLFYVLCCLVNNQNHLVTRKQLIEECWNGNEYTGEKAVTHTICQLRKLFKDLKITIAITTLSKQGYVLTSLDSVPRQLVENNIQNMSA